MCDMMNYESPDAFGAQEATYPQIVDMLGMLDGYGYTGRGRDDGDRGGEYACIFYRKSRLELLDEGTFWLSETPGQVSFGWDAACRRVCSWAKFRQLGSGFTFYHFNLHMDHVGVVARREAARLVIERIESIAGSEPVVLTGDFNVDQNDEIYTIFSHCPLLKDSYTASRLRFAENGTYIAFDPNAKTESRIDHIFVSPQFYVDRYAILTCGYWTAIDNAASTNEHNGPAEVKVTKFRHHTPSDHYPVVARMIWSNSDELQ
jgi:endonuclease/exonuclease/phosphatase family metal-dependent hydrolase